LTLTGSTTTHVSSGNSTIFMPASPWFSFLTLSARCGNGQLPHDCADGKRLAALCGDKEN
jgi:hypothetical protein